MEVIRSDEGGDHLPKESVRFYKTIVALGGPFASTKGWERRTFGVRNIT